MLLFDRGEEAEMFHVPSGPALHDLLGSTFGFEFYVTDREGSYRVCFTHHDMLVGLGQRGGMDRGAEVEPWCWGR